MRPTAKIGKTNMLRETLTIAIFVFLISRTSGVAQAQAPRSPTPVNGVVDAETVARGLEHPWALAFLPDGRMLVTERPGRLRIVDRNGRVSKPLEGAPHRRGKIVIKVAD
jgi:glucose/arabinose dehydrogenase